MDIWNSSLYTLDSVHWIVYTTSSRNNLITLQCWILFLWTCFDTGCVDMIESTHPFSLVSWLDHSLPHRRMTLMTVGLNASSACVRRETLSSCHVATCVCATAVLTICDTRPTTVQSAELHSGHFCRFEPCEKNLHWTLLTQPPMWDMPRPRQSLVYKWVYLVLRFTVLPTPRCTSECT